MATLEPRIIDLLAKDPERLFSISDIAKELKVAYSHAHIFVNRLIAEGIISRQLVGKTIVCRLDLKQPLTLARLSEMSYAHTFAWTKKDPRAKKIFERIDLIKENIHCALLQNSKIILVIPESAKNADFSIFENRRVLTPYELRKNKSFYTNILILHGAEKYWSLIHDA